jgi:hypothetical protein
MATLTLLVVSALSLALMALIAFWGWVWLQVSRASPEAVTAHLRYAARLTGWILIGYAAFGALSLLYIGAFVARGPSVVFN